MLRWLRHVADERKKTDNRCMRRVLLETLEPRKSFDIIGDILEKG